MCVKCTRCERTMSYDPYFKANVCRYCGAKEYISVKALAKKKAENINEQKNCNMNLYKDKKKLGTIPAVTFK